MDIRAEPGTTLEKYRFKVQFSSTGKLTRDSMSRSPLSPEFDEIETGWRAYHAQLRWSIPFPMFTPFDAYLTYLDVDGDLFRKSWWAAAERGELALATKRQLAAVAEHLASVAAWLTMDHFAGFAGTEPFNQAQAVVDRTEAIGHISRIVDENPVPLVETLQTSGVLDLDFIIVSPVQSEIRGRLEGLLTLAKLLRPQLPDQSRKLLASPRRNGDILTVPTSSLFIEALVANSSLIERFTQQHRIMDVKMVQAQLRSHELENLRFAARLLAKEREVPEIERKIVIEGNTGSAIVPPADA